MKDFPITVRSGIAHRTMMSEFLRDNPDLPDEEREAVKNLKLGASTAVGIGGGGFVEIERPRPRRSYSYLA